METGPLEDRQGFSLGLGWFDRQPWVTKNFKNYRRFFDDLRAV
jgi:hypothetical protein